MTLGSNDPQSSSLRPHKILVRGVNWLGDAVMSTPALQCLREAKPAAHITLLTHEKLAGLWQDHPAINEIQTFATGQGAWRVGQQLRGGKFDLALALANSHRSAIELWIAGIPERVGSARPFRNCFLTKPVRPRDDAVQMRKRSRAEIDRLIVQAGGASRTDLPKAVHHIFQYLHLVAALGVKSEVLAPYISVSEKEVSAFRRRLTAVSGSGSTHWLGLNPGAEYGPAKRWPAERFIAAALEIHRTVRCGWIIFGVNDPATLRVAEKLKSKLGRELVANFSGGTTLRELCAGLKFCKLVLTNDSGPMHVAAAVGTPVVVPFGSTSSTLTGPGLPGSDGHVVLQSSVPCSPCFLRECPIDFRCMNSIEVVAVVDACLRRLGKL